MILSAWTGGHWSRVAASAVPSRVFYEKRGGKSTEFPFQHARRTKTGLTAQSLVRDTQGNNWRVVLEASSQGSDAVRCGFTYTLLEGTATNVFFEHAWVPAMPASGEETYVLMPGLLYDGNRLTRPSKAIPQLAAAENFEVNTPVLTLAIPVSVSYEKKTGRTLMVLTEPATELDMTGFTYVQRPDDHHVSVVTPLYREKHFHHDAFAPEQPKGASLAQGATFHVTVTLVAAVLPDIPAVFEALEPLRALARTPFTRNRKLPLSAAAGLVQANLNERMWCEEDGFYINAMLPEFDIHRAGCRPLRTGWQLQTGWCSGAVTAYALLKLGDSRSHGRAVRMLDRIANGGASPSGLVYSIFANGMWDAAANNSSFNQHLRMPADVSFFLQRSLALERIRGVEHPDWQALVIANLDAFVTLWRQNGEFGRKVDRVSLKITDPGTAACALGIGALALGRALPRGEEYLAVAKEAADSFYLRIVRAGWIIGGPLDIPNAPDSESVMGLLEGYVTLYEATRGVKYLGYARATVRHLASWVVAYNAPFPAGTFCAENGIQSVGGVLANSQNHHIGPSFCTHSGEALLRYFRYSGDVSALRLLQDTMEGSAAVRLHRPGKGLQADEARHGDRAVRYERRATRARRHVGGMRELGVDLRPLERWGGADDLCRRPDKGAWDFRSNRSRTRLGEGDSARAESNRV